MPARQAERRTPQSRRFRAFGLDLRASFDVPGLVEAAGRDCGRSARLDLATPEAIARGWPASGGTRVMEERLGGRTPARTIDFHPRAGYRLYARGHGVARVSPSGARIACAPAATGRWRWARFLVGRVLPWAAVLRGYEVVHASAVAIDGLVIALSGPTGTGKTSLALQLVAAGADFVADDVLALERDGDRVLAHPGPCTANVRPAERAAIPDATWRRLGTVVGRSGKTHISLPVVHRPLPLGAVCFLDAGAGAAVERVERADPRLLLASTFVLGVQTAERLSNQLDICAAIAREVPVFRVHVDHGGGGSAQLAAAIHAELSGALVA